MSQTVNAVNDAPLLSVIIESDNYERITTVIDSLAAQTLARQLELVLIMTAPLDEAARATLASSFHGIQVIVVPTLVPLSRPRAMGVRAARAPFVMIAETHAYPDPTLAEKLVAALSAEWSVAIPGFRNANPGSGLSWAGFLGDYGAWAETLAAGETDRSPSHNSAYRRSALLEFGDRLENVLTFGDELNLTLRANGHRSYFEPSARIQHVNMDRFRWFVRERYLFGVLTGGYRRVRWGWIRRLAYAFGSPLIPIVLLARMRSGVADVRRSHSLPAATIPALVLGAVLKATGEMRGYLFGAPASAEEWMTRFEVQKIAFNDGTIR